MTQTADTSRLSPRYGWLAAVIPADARRFRVDDPALGAALAAAGAELVDASPDVEIADAGDVRGDARYAVVAMQGREPSADMRLIRGAQRLARVARMRAQAQRARRTMVGRGYAETELIEWDRGTSVQVKDVRRGVVRAMAHRFPLNAVVVGRRRSETTAFEAAVGAAADAIGRPFRIESILFAASGVIVAVGDTVVVRVGVGPAASRIDEARLSLEALVRRLPPPVVADRVATVEGHGVAGIAVWSAERRLPGHRAPSQLTKPIVADCLDFLVSLHELGSGGASRSLEPLAEAVALAAGAGCADGVRALAAELDERLADVSRGFDHGDFWTGNLLLEDGRLTGVVDWPAGGAGALPVLDLLHLQANVAREATGRGIGPVIVEDLLPNAASGGDDLVRAYCRRIALGPQPEVLVDLVKAYWIHAVAHELLDPDRDLQESARPRWREMNIDNVLRILARSSRGARAVPSRRRWNGGDERATVITDHAQLRELEGEWSQLAEERANPFVSPSWFWTWLETCGRGDRPFVPVLRDREGRLVGLLPFVRSGGKRFARLGFAGATFGDYFHPVAREGEAERRTSAAAIRALQERRRDWSVLVADYVDESALWVAELAAAPGRGEVALVPYHDHASVYRFADLEGLSWDDYLSTRSRNFREQLRRRQRRLSKAHAVTFRRADDTTLVRDMEMLFELHARRWEGRQSEMFATDQAKAFHLGVARAALAQDWLRLWVLEVDGRAIGAWYGWRLADRYLYYQAGFDPAWADYSPGVLLLAHTIRDAIEEGAQTYDMLLGDETYKARFADGQRTARTFVLTRRRHPARVVVASDIAVRRAVRRLPANQVRQVRNAVAPVLRRWPITTAP